MYVQTLKRISDEMGLPTYHDLTPISKLVFDHGYQTWFLQYSKDPVHRIIAIRQDGEWTVESSSGTTSPEGTFYSFDFPDGRMEIPEDEFNEIWTGTYGPRYIYGRQVIDTTRYGRPVTAIAVTGYKNLWIVNVCNPEEDSVDLMLVDISIGNQPLVVGTLEVIVFAEANMSQKLYRKVRAFILLRKRGQWRKW